VGHFITKESLGGVRDATALGAVMGTHVDKYSCERRNSIMVRYTHRQPKDYSMVKGKDKGPGGS